MFRSSRRARYATLMTLAVRHVAAGRPKAALKALQKARKWDDRNSPIVDAMLAYCCVVTDDRQEAANACRRVLDAKEENPDADRQYIDQYCHYLEAVLANDYLDYVSQWQKLQIMPHSVALDDALPVDRLMVLGPVSVLTAD